MRKLFIFVVCFLMLTVFCCTSPQKKSVEKNPLKEIQQPDSKKSEEEIQNEYMEEVPDVIIKAVKLRFPDARIIMLLPDDHYVLTRIGNKFFVVSVDKKTNKYISNYKMN